MPEQKRTIRRRVFRLAVLSLTAWGLVSLGRPMSPSPAQATPAQPAPEPLPEAPARRRPPRRFGSALVFAILFFAGASFTAIAGDQTVQLLAEDAAEVAAAPAEAPAPEAATPEAPVSEPAADEATAEEPAVAELAEEPSAETGEDLVAAPARFAPSAAPSADDTTTRTSTKARRAPASTRPAPVESLQPLDAEADSPGATIWLHRAVPELIPSFRLTPRAAGKLARTARRAGLDWAVVLGVLRANGKGTVREATPLLRKLGAAEDPWNAALGFTGRTAAADRAVALAHYYRAVGLKTIVRGLEARKQALVREVLADPRVNLSAGGRWDFEADHVDVRVVALIAYLAETYGQVTVSSLVSGHRHFARPGVVSAHVYGLAVDIAALGGVPVTGHQQPGGIVEQAVRDILLLPAEMRPTQVISLLGLGGPSFPLADHHDHIHVGY